MCVQAQRQKEHFICLICKMGNLNQILKEVLTSFYPFIDMGQFIITLTRWWGDYMGDMSTASGFPRWVADTEPIHR